MTTKCDYMKPSNYHQPIEGFTRIVEDTFEHVDYLKGSSIRIWFNDQSNNYTKHWHTATEIIMPVDNHYTVTVNQVDYHLNVGDILVIPSGEMHELLAPDTGSRLIFLFDFSSISKLKGFSSILPLLVQPLYISPQTAPQIYEVEYDLLLQMRNEYFSNNTLRELVIYAHLINFFVHIGRNHLDIKVNSPYIRSDKRHEYMETFNQVLDYIDNHYMDELSLEIIANKAGFSKYYFTRLFKQYTDTTFYDYLSYKRIRVAEDLLSRPEMSITEIALQAGFSSISTFNRIFKKLKNCSPTEYRESYCPMSNKAHHSKHASLDTHSDL